MTEYAWKKGETRHRAREAVMFYILSSCVSNARSENRFDTTGGIHGFIRDGDPQIGDLVILESTRTWSKWQIGWLREINTGNHEKLYVIESLEDGELCNWTNVGISYLPRNELSDHASWQWNDRQWQFWKRWERVCYRERDAYMVLPLPPKFGSGYSVTLGTRTRFGFDDLRPSLNFPDWRKVTKAMMADCYDQCVRERAKGNNE